MRSLVVVFVLLLSSPWAFAANGKDESKAVLTAVQTLLDGWREADATKAGSVLHPDFREVTYHLFDGKWQFAAVTREKLLRVVGKISKGDWDDRLIEPHVHVDGPIASVWSHYRFKTGDEAHCGIETFQLYHVEAGWQIVNFADTHIDGCKDAR